MTTMTATTPVSLTDEQYQAAAHLLDFPKRVQTLGGFAGTGKTTLIRYLHGLLPGFAVCAYTGKAANVLRKKGLHASTIHSLIYQPEEVQHWDESKKKYVPEVVFHKVEDVTCAGFLVDEASMVSEDIHEDLCSFQKPIIYVGDHGQLPPVKSSFNLMANPDIRLETIHRNAGEIARFAEFIRKGNSPSAWQHQPGYSGEKVVFTQRSALFQSQAEGGLLFTVDQIICARNDLRVSLNQWVRQGLGRPSDMPVGGDRVMCLQNSTKYGVFNGMQGVVEAVGGDHMDFRSEEKVYRVAFIPEAFNHPRWDGYRSRHRLPFDYAYAITCHKCVHPNTLVETTEGLLPITKIAGEGTIATPNGPKKYTNQVFNPEGPALKIVTHHGYEITVTPDHKVEAWDGESYHQFTANQLTKGQYVRLKLGHTIEPTTPSLPPPGIGDVRAKKISSPGLTDDLAEFFGLMVADGTLFARGIRLAKRHEDVLWRFEYLCETIFNCKPRRVMVNNTKGIEVSATILADWLRSVGGMKPNGKMVPECILKSPLPIQRAFIRGVMEDGCVGLTKEGDFNYIQFTSHSKLLLETIRVMLLRLGIVTSTLNNSLYIYGTNGVKFREQVGFISQFKNKRLFLCRESERYSVIPVSKSESWLLKPYLSSSSWYNVRSRGYISRTKSPALPFLIERMNYYHDRIETIEPILCESACVEVPDGHKFLQNGFPFGNSQGDEWNHVLVFEERCDHLWEHARWAYTAASRARERLTWVIDG